MLRKLSIRNYALIRELELEFDSGLNIITGETGAGKSIMIGALGLILGKRADVNVLNIKDQNCFVEAVFDMDYALLSKYFEDYDIDIEERVILRRQINPQGKSRAFVNDSPVKLPVLRELSSRLIDVNSQYQTFSLNEAKSQLQLLDDYAGLKERLSVYRENFINYKLLKQELAQIEEEERSARSEQDFLQFQFEELERANLEEGEFSVLETELEVLNHSEEIKTNLYEAEICLQADEIGSIEKLSSAVHNLDNISAYHSDYKSLSSRLESLLFEMKDISQEIETIKDNIEFNATHLEKLNNRIDLLNNLQQKHALDSADKLIALKNSIEERILDFSRISVNKDALQNRIIVLFDKMTKQADKIHEIRMRTINEVQDKVVDSLANLGMKGAGFKIDLEKGDKLNEAGNSKVQFLFSANKGVELGIISKIASGGELSRLMLAIKYVLTSKKSLSTIIFDEIDTGVSGDIANMVGDMMRSMGLNMQLIAITHLPQIAGKAKSHFKVYKQEVNNQTFSSIKLLNEEERIEELSLMLSGKKDSVAATATAKELME